MTLIVEKARGDTQRILDIADAEIVLPIRAWATLASIGYSTAKKLLAAGRGPKVTYLTSKRVGIRMSEHQKWLTSRTTEWLRSDHDT